MRLGYYIIILSVFLFASCSEKEKDLREKDYASVKSFTEGQSTKYTEYSTGEFVGRHIKGSGFPGFLADTMWIKYVGRVINSEKTIFATNYEEVAKANKLTLDDKDFLEKIVVVSNIDMIKGLKNGLPRLYEGDSASIAIPFAHAYGESGTGLVPPYTGVVFDVKVIKTSGVKATAEKKVISDYVNSNPEFNIKVKDYVYKKVITPGTENGAIKNDTIIFDYKITTLDNNLVLENNGESVVYGNIKDDQIYAFDFILEGVKKGDSIHFIVPSHLSVRSESTIYQYYTPLIYQLKVKEVRTKTSS